MSFHIQTPPERVAYFLKSGLWPNRLLTEYLDEAVATNPQRAAVVGYDSRTGKRTVHSYEEFNRIVDRIALGLVSYGIGPGDVVSMQLPNYWQFNALFLACLRIGAITNPLMPIFRHRELSFMLSFGQAKAIFVSQDYRGFDYPGMIAELRGDLPALEHVFVVGGTGADSFDSCFIDRRWESELDRDAVFAERQPSPNDVSLLMYTSGTTGQPKGVMHTQNTLIGNIVKFAERVGLDSSDTVLMASPLAHLTGFLYGLMMPVALGGPSVLMDIWDPAEAARIVEAEQVTFTMASTPFLSDLTNTPAVDNHNLDSLLTFLTAGAPIPRVLAERAAERLNVMVNAAWGMTENGGVTTTRPGDPADRIFGSDGAPIEGMEVRVVGEDGKPLPTGTEGRLQARGMANFVGYLKKPELFATDAEGWFETGDLARMRDDGYIRISGRSKDVIIRGGENIPIVEVEELLYRHPAIQDAAIVAMPDERLGERGCVFITLQQDQTLTFDGMIRYLTEQKMAKQYFPERLEVIEEMPRTPSGKIQKFRLREIAEGLSV
ncbi:MAG: AMP-binding protein [Alphaproteobacteria bacterium]|nr:AMP-binding protein [Alphaproteobacteria bacterium]